MSQVRSHFGADGSCGLASDGRHLGSGKRAPFTRYPRNRSRRPLDHGVLVATAAPRHSRGGDRGVRGGRDGMPRGRQRPSRSAPRGRRSGCRVVNRDAPQPRLHRAAPSCLLPPSRASGWAREERETDVSRERARAARLGRSATCAREHRKGFSSKVAALGNGEPRVLEFDTFRSAEIDWTHLVRNHRAHARVRPEPRGLARTDRPRRSDVAGATDRERRRCVSASSLRRRRDAALVLRAQASSGSLPDPVRARRLGMSWAASMQEPIRWKGVRVVSLLL